MSTSGIAQELVQLLIESRVRLDLMGLALLLVGLVLNHHAQSVAIFDCRTPFRGAHSDLGSDLDITFEEAVYKLGSNLQLGPVGIGPRRRLWRGGPSLPETLGTGRMDAKGLWQLPAGLRGRG